ncbi:MAG TPA: PIN domain-containing protein [Flavobacteriales bacterium]|nr:PIN domain-containing protein [Flavobacteriales bacterium]
MKIFLDANILVSVLNKEYPSFAFTSRLLSLADKPGFTLSTSPLCLGIAWYFAEKKSGRKIARQKIDLLLGKLIITTMGHETSGKAAANKKINDFEDGLQYYSAIESACNCIVTENEKDFYFSEIPVMNSRTFMEKLATNKLNLS